MARTFSLPDVTGNASRYLQINAGETALVWTAAAPVVSTLAWNTTASGGSGTGLLLTLSNSYGVSGIGQSIVMGNTQTNAATLLNLDTGTSAIANIGLLIKAYGANTSQRGLKIDMSTTGTGNFISITGGAAAFGIQQNELIGLANNTYAPIFLSTAVSGAITTNRTTDYTTINHQRINSSTSGTVVDNFNLCLIRRRTDQTGAGGTITEAGSVLQLTNELTISAGTLTDTVKVLTVTQSESSTGAALSIPVPSSRIAGTDPVINVVLGNTQTQVSTLSLLDTGTSSVANVGQSIKVYNASGSAKGLSIDLGSTGTGSGITISQTTLAPGSTLFSISQLSSGTHTNRTIDGASININRTHTAATSISSTFNGLIINRVATMNNAGGTFTEAGTVLKLQNVVINTAGTSTNNVSTLYVVQDALSTGLPISIQQDRVTSTNFRKIMGETNTGINIWMSNGTDPNGTLTGTAGDICLNGASNKPAYCTGTTVWVNLV